MSSATLQQISNDLPSWVGLARKGETIAIMEAGEIIAHLGPPSNPTKASPAPPKSMSDWMALQDVRMRQTFGNRIVDDSSPMLDDMRAELE